MAKKKKDSFYLIGVLVIIIAGFCIFVFNLIKGENLFTKKPDFNFEQYLDPKDYNPFYFNKMRNLAKKIDSLVNNENQAQANESETEKGIYFTKFFLKDSPIDTYNNINDFWKNINASQDVKVSDLYAKDCFIVEVPADDREESLMKLKENEQIKELQVIEPPHWKVCYLKSYYPEQIEKMYASDDINLLEEQNESDYIAKLESEVTEEEMKKIEEMYSDVIQIKD